MSLNDIIDKMIASDASDIFIRAGSPLKGRIYGEIKIINDEKFTEIGRASCRERV